MGDWSAECFGVDPENRDVVPPIRDVPELHNPMGPGRDIYDACMAVRRNLTFRRYPDGFWLRVGRLSFGFDPPDDGYRPLAEREGWNRVWRAGRWRIVWHGRGV